MKFRLIISVLLCLVIKMVEGSHTFYMDQLCDSTLDMTGPDRFYALRLKLTKDRYYNANLRCEFHLWTKPNETLTFYFDSMDISDMCDNYWLAVLDGLHRETAPPVHGMRDRYCGVKKPEGTYRTASNVLTLYFNSDRMVRYGDFDIVVFRGKPLGPGAIAGIILGNVAFLTIVVVSGIYVMRRREQTSRRKERKPATISLEQLYNCHILPETDITEGDKNTGFVTGKQ